MQTQEQWKDILGYEGLYQASDMGNIKSLKFGKERILNINCLSTTGYYKVCLVKSGKQKVFTVHQLVAMTFLNHKPDGHNLVIDHINSNKLDNRLENLRIITNRENVSKERTLKSKLPVGVSKSYNKFLSRIRIKNERIILGLFSTQEEASKAYQDKLKEIQQLSSNIEVKD